MGSTRSSAPRREATARLVALVLATALVAAGCAGSPRATLTHDEVAADRSNALAVVADDDDVEIDESPPELLGRGAVSSDLPPAELAMTDDAVTGTDPAAADESVDDPGGEATSATTTDVPAAGSEATDETTDETTAEPTPVADPLAEARALLSDESDGDGADAGDDAGAEPLPDPPPAAPGNPSLYDDPSEPVVTASGRPLPAITAPRTPARGVTARTITIGAIVSSTLAEQPFRGAACDGARARYEQANAHGELSRRIVFAGCLDDAGRIDLAEGLARSSVRDGWFAVAPVASPAFLAEDVLTDAGVPHVGDEALPAFCGRDTRFGFGIAGAAGCPVLDARGFAVLATPVLTALVEAREEPLPESILVLAENGPAGVATMASLELEARLGEFPRPTSGPTLPTIAEGLPASWRDVATAVVADDPDMVLIDAPVTEGLPAALRTAGFDGEIVLVGPVDPLDVADAQQRTRLAPLTVVTPGLDVADRSTPGWQAMEGAAAAIGVAPAEIGIDFVEGYVAADLLVRAIAATPEPLSGPALAEMASEGWWYPGIEGLACGSWWPTSSFLEAPCVSVARVDPFRARLVPVVDLVEIAPRLAWRFGR